MFKSERIKKMGRSLVSVLLMLSLMLSFAAPVNVIAAVVSLADTGEEAATGSDIYAILYYIDPTKISGGKIATSKNVELVLQRGGITDPDRTVVTLQKDDVTADCIWNDFADRDCDLSPPWHAAGYNYSGKGHINSIYKVTVKDKIAPTYMSGWFYDQREMVEIVNVENINTINCKSFKNTFNYSWGIRELDLSSWRTDNLLNAAGMFSHQGNASYRGLRKLNISTWTVPKCTNLNTFLYESQIEDPDISSMSPTSCTNFVQMLMNNHQLKTVKIGPMSTGNQSEPFFTSLFANCENLESVYSEGEPIYGKVDLSAWTSSNMRRFNSMFLNCAKIKEVDFGSNIQSSYRDYANAFSSTFSGCTSLETIRFNFAKGALCANAPTFLGCSSLTELDFSGLETTTYSDRETSDLSASTNIYEGCTELYKVTFNANYPTAAKAGTSVPPRPTWARIKNADGSDYTGPKEVLSAAELFLDFRPAYAGTWVAVDKIVLNANGGTPSQSIDGAKDLPLEYDPNEIVDPEKVGYDFIDWYSEKEEGEGELLAPGAIAQSYIYYAHWDPHHYNLVIDGNGGTVPEDAELNGGVVSADRKTITYSNVSYPEFIEISRGMFQKTTASRLTSWNTRANGLGDGFMANDSVNKLTPTDGDTVTLFAQWDELDYVVSFDSQGGTKVNSKYYERNNPYGTLPIPEKTGYSFLGWYTESEGGTQISASAKVNSDVTLYAHWQEDPKVYFHPNPNDPEPGATDVPQLDGSAEVQFKVYKVGQNLGVLPVPDWGTRTFKGWYEDKTAESDATRAKTSTVITEDADYYAHWGYKPTFETDGGTYVSYDASNYEIQDSPSYTVSVLPEITKPFYTLDGWYFCYTEGGVQKEQKIAAGDTLDLTKGTVVRAKWTPTSNICTITLNADGGTVSRTRIKVYAGHAIGELPTPTKAGCTFVGWYRDGASQPDTYESTYSSDTVLTARWAQNDLTVTFDPNGGTMADNPTVKLPSGGTIDSLPGANRKNLSFDGWYLKDGEGLLDESTRLTTSTPITANCTYYAKWVDRELSNDRYRYEIQWDTPSDTEVTNTGDHLVFHPTVAGEISAHLHIHFRRINANYPIEAGDIVVIVPDHIFFDKDGNPVGENNITADSDFSVTSLGNGYLKISNKNLFAKDFDLEYHYDVDPLLLEGYYEGDVYHPEYFCHTFPASISVNDADNSSFNIDYSKDLSMEVHTSANITAEKLQSDVSLVWDTKWGTPAPPDASEYFYVTWRLRSSVTNCSQHYDIKWSEDTVHDGTVIYTENVGSWAVNKNGGRYDAIVVTKHRRDAASNGTNWITVNNEAILSADFVSGNVENIRVSAQASAYIENSGSGQPVPFRKTIPNYTDDDVHLRWPSGQDYILNNRYPEDDYFFPYLTTYVGTTEPDRVRWNAATGTYSIGKRTILISDGAKGDVVHSTAKGADQYLWSSSTNHELGSGDYSFVDLKITLTEYDAICLDGKWSNPFAHADAIDYGTVIVRVRTTANNNLEVCYSQGGLSEHNIVLPSGTYYYEIEHDSSFYKTDITVEANMFLNFTNKLKSLVAEDVFAGYETLIKNNSTLKLTRDGVTQTIHSKDYSEYGEAWPCIYRFGRSRTELYAAKNCATVGQVSMHGETSTEDFPVVISGWTYTNGDVKKAVKTGVFHDLLPAECAVSKDTVFVTARTMGSSNAINLTADQYDNQKRNALDAGYYSVVFEENYENSGRTMMTVYVTAPEYDLSTMDEENYSKTATGFNVFYKMKTTYSNIHRNGENLINTVAFTDTTELQGKPDVRNGTIVVLDQQSKPYFRSFDGEQTAFASAKTNCITPSNYTYGMDSVVLAEGTDFTGEEVVGLNSHYAYRVCYGDNSKVTDMVFYDVLETDIDGLETEWTGEFLSVDVSAIKSIKSAPGTTGNCAPKVRYSTKEKSYFSSNDKLDIDDDEVWQDDPPAVLSSVTAVAVDCRKTNTNDDFILDKKKNLVFYINMLSPDSGVSSGDVARNETIVKGTNYENGRPASGNTRTNVIIRFANPELDKQAFPKAGTLLEPEEVVLNSVLKYSLIVSNPDKYVPITDIVIEDYLDPTLKLSNTVMVTVGDDDPIAVDRAARISSYSTKTVTVDGVSKLKFTATINSLEPEETIEIMIPVTVSAKPLPDGILRNQAQIISANSVDFTTPILSPETYHKVTGAKAKVIKIKSNGNPLPGAKLQILNEDKQPIELFYEGVPAGEGDDNNYFTSTDKVKAFDVAPGIYYLHEDPDGLPAGYETPAADIKFRIDVEGMHYIVNSDRTETSVSHIEMTNIAPYQVIYHTNLPTGADSEFLSVDSVDLVENKVPAFSEIPQFKNDEYYMFMGWYTAPDGGEKVTFDRIYTETTDLYAQWHEYKIIFHENKPGDGNKVFKTYVPRNGDLNARDGINHFYEIPTFAGDEYVFAGWYHNAAYTMSLDGATIAADFDHDAYLKKAQGAADPDYHLYAKWIQVGTVSKDAKDEKILTGSGSYRGFGLEGVQIRDEDMHDENYNDEITPAGMRFVTSLSENLLGQINSIEKIATASTQANTFGVEYGYVVGTKANMDAFKSHYNITGDKASAYKLQYNGENVNGVDTTGKQEKAENDFRYVSNVDCTSRVAPNSGTAKNSGVVALDHQNFTAYRLYTLVVTYDDEDSASSMDSKIDARAYIRYYDANGKLRVFYNNYNDNADYHGGCLCSYNQVKGIASEAFYN